MKCTAMIVSLHVCAQLTAAGTASQLLALTPDLVYYRFQGLLLPNMCADMNV